MDHKTSLSSAEQLRAARALVRMDQQTLADQAEISVPSIKRLEAGTGDLKANSVTVVRLNRALERAGVTFIEDGVKLRRPQFRDLGAATDDLLNRMAMERESLPNGQLVNIARALIGQIVDSMPTANDRAKLLAVEDYIDSLNWIKHVPF
jgi:predicted transcriptional regulator